MSHMKPLAPSPVLSGWHFASQLPKKGKGSSSSPQRKNSRGPAGPQPSARGGDQLPSETLRRRQTRPRAPPGSTDVRTDPRALLPAPQRRSCARRLPRPVPGPPRDRPGNVRGPAWTAAEGEARAISRRAVESLFLSAGGAGR